MTLTEKEEYKLTIKNLQSKIDYLRDQREILTKYGTRKPLTKEHIERNFLNRVDFVRQVEAAHGIK